MLLTQAGIGELRLILPVLQQLTQNAYVMWINPPFIPYATALEACGVNTRNILVVRTQSHEDTLWSMERCCLSSGCAGVLAWPDERKLNIKETRRVQLAARSGCTLALFFRPISATTRSSLAELRLALRPTHSVDQLSLDIVKRKGGWPVHDIKLCLTEATHTPTTSCSLCINSWLSGKNRVHKQYSQKHNKKEKLPKNKDKKILFTPTLPTT